MKKLLNIPDEIEVICMLPMGYADQEAPKRTLKNAANIVHKEEWKE